MPDSPDIGAGSLRIEDVRAFAREFDADPHNRVMQNVLTTTGLTEVARSHQVTINTDHTFSHVFPFDGDKSARLAYHMSRMNHAMLFTGVDLVDGRPRRWRVENSWGEDPGRKGFFVMNDNWFGEYVFEIAAAGRYLDDGQKAALEVEPVVLPPWDPMGSLA